MWTTIVNLLGGVLSKLGIDYLKFRKEEAANTEREDVLKKVLETERESNEMDHSDRVDELRNWVRKSDR